MSLLLGLITGLVLGLTGAGGSALAVPLLMWGLGWSLPQAAPVALVAVCASALFGTVVAWDVAYIRYRAALLMALASLVTAPLGLWLATRLPHAVLAGLFGAVLAIVALRNWRLARRAPREAAIVRATVAGDEGAAAGPVCRLDARGRLIWNWPCATLIAATGAATGFLSGLLGVGGGFVIVPSLRAGSELSMHSAIATSLLAIALISAVTVLMSLLQGHALPWAIALPFVLGALGGMYGGRRLAPRIAGARLQEAFALLMLLVAGGLVAQVTGWP
ncbi:sulfite exporter TauE/SafE family protein [Solimonas soli]|uniref:sulfite exporter TauE/SafE family protein n=1 Tax=Solimonas soli TaxID=413479 RepID=UPI000488614B|nr:sulfite exporter TauE/SafE family protein [Solimonas soli]